MSDAAAVAVEDVAVLRGDDLEVELGVHGVRPRAAQVEVDAGRARVGAGDAVVHDVLLRDHALALGALQEDRVGVDERLVLLDLRREQLEELAALVDPAVGQVVTHAAEAVVVEHHARARELLHEVEDELAVAEHVEDHGRAERREVGGEGADRHQVAGDAHELAGDDADELRPPRDLHAGELLDRHDVGPLAVDAGEVLGAVHDRDVLEVGALLGQFLLAAMQVADDRDDVLDELAVEGDDQAQHAVRAGMLRPHVDDDLVEREAVDVGALAARRRFFDAAQGQLHGLVRLRSLELVIHAGGSPRGRRSLCATGGRRSRP